MSQLGLGGLDAGAPAPTRRGGARFSDCRRYRWTLWRSWSGEVPAVVDGVVVGDKSRMVAWVLVNPSIAGASWEDNDPTVGKGIGFSRSWGFDGMLFGNLWPWISTDPAGLLAARDMDALNPSIMGLADDAIREVCAGAGRIVFAWGSHAKIGSLVEARAANVRKVIETLPRRGPVVCLGRNADGQPKHPGRIGYSTAVETIWEGRP